MPRLGVNIDHIATIREARKVSYPAPVEALSILKECAVDQVTIHLREDRRHIHDHDFNKIMAANVLPVNLEMAVTNEMIGIASCHKPKMVTLVPEKREEVTTEGGLDCASHLTAIRDAVKQLKDVGIHTSLFVDPNKEQILASVEAGADAIEIHTGTYCNIIEKHFEETGHYNSTAPAIKDQVVEELSSIAEMSKLAEKSKLKVYAGHGLHIHNLSAVAEIKEIEEYNIGHAIIARSIFIGLKQAIQEIQEIL